jgi:phosphoserine phosphatase
MISGGFVRFVERVRDAIGFDLAQASRLEDLNGHLNGHPLGSDPRQRATAAAERVLRLQPQQTLPPDDTATDSTSEEQLPAG